MSYAVQVICVIAIVGGWSFIARKVESEQMRLASVYVVVGIPLIVAYMAGSGRKLQERIDRLEKKLDPNHKAGGL